MGLDVNSLALRIAMAWTVISPLGIVSMDAMLVSMGHVVSITAPQLVLTVVIICLVHAVLVWKVFGVTNVKNLATTATMVVNSHQAFAQMVALMASMVHNVQRFVPIHALLHSVIKAPVNVLMAAERGFMVSHVICFVNHIVKEIFVTELQPSVQMVVWQDTVAHTVRSSAGVTVLGINVISSHQADAPLDATLVIMVFSARTCAQLIAMQDSVMNSLVSARLDATPVSMVKNATTFAPNIAREHVTKLMALASLVNLATMVIDAMQHAAHNARMVATV